MTTGWLDGFDRSVPGQDSGSFVAAPARLVLHTTEGASAAGAIAAFKSTGSWPHFTVDGARKIRYQHIPMNLGARALVHAPGTVETNRQGAVQIEMVGFAAQTQDWTDDTLRWLAVNVFAPIFVATGISQIHPGFVGADQSPSGVHAKQRFTEQGWAVFDGICGHQHVPCGNDHWDPGAFPIARLLTFLDSPTPAPAPVQEDAMEIIKVTAKVTGTVDQLWLRQGPRYKHIPDEPGYYELVRQFPGRGLDKITDTVDNAVTWALVSG